eukprot:1917228-Rhodomonas_salina.1
MYGGSVCIFGLIVFGNLGGIVCGFGGWFFERAEISFTTSLRACISSRMSSISTVSMKHFVCSSGCLCSISVMSVFAIGVYSCCWRGVYVFDMIAIFGCPCVKFCSVVSLCSVFARVRRSSATNKFMMILCLVEYPRGSAMWILSPGMKRSAGDCAGEPLMRCMSGRVTNVRMLLMIFLGLLSIPLYVSGGA